jgi:hypothetical protein
MTYFSFLFPSNIIRKGNTVCILRNSCTYAFSKNMGTVEDTVEKGLELFEFLGLGGMGTRGFGRFRVLNLKGA